MSSSLKGIESYGGGHSYAPLKGTNHFETFMNGGREINEEAFEMPSSNIVRDGRDTLLTPGYLNSKAKANIKYPIETFADYHRTEEHLCPNCGGKSKRQNNLLILGAIFALLYVTRKK